jgi:TolB-like protein
MKKPVAVIFFLLSAIFAFCDVTLDQAIENARMAIEAALADGTRIVVVDFEDATKVKGTAVNTEMAEYVTEKLETGFSNGRVLTVITRSKLRTVQNERDYQNSGYVNDEQAAELGKELGAQAVITGRLRKLAGKYQLTITAIDVETSKIEVAYETTIKSDKVLEGLLGITALREQEQAAARERKEQQRQERAAAREQERQEKEQAEAEARKRKEDQKQELSLVREQNAARRDMKIILGVRAALDFTLSKPSDEHFSGTVTEDKVSFLHTPVFSGFFGINSVSKAMGFRIEASYFRNNGLNVQHNGNSHEFSWDTFDVAVLYNFGFAESTYLMGVFAGPYGSMPLGKMRGGENLEIDKSIFGMMSSWGLLGGLKAGVKLGPGYLTFDGRYFYDLNETKVNDIKFVRRSGILAGLGYEFWL